MRLAFVLFMISTMALASDSTSLCQKNIDPVANMTSAVRSLNDQCLDAITKDFLTQSDNEISELREYEKAINRAIKKVAVNMNAIIVNCGVETLNKLESVLKCRKLSVIRNSIRNQIYRNEDWQNKFKSEIHNPRVAIEQVGGHPV